MQKQKKGSCINCKHWDKDYSQCCHPEQLQCEYGEYESPPEKHCGLWEPKEKQNQEQTIVYDTRKVIPEILNEFDSVYKEYKDYTEIGDWGNAIEARSYLLGMAKCMTILSTKEIDEQIRQQVIERCNLISW